MIAEGWGENQPGDNESWVQGGWCCDRGAAGGGLGDKRGSFGKLTAGDTHAQGSGLHRVLVGIEAQAPAMAVSLLSEWLPCPQPQFS